ncbi:hypothetical protein K7X08_029856 [Anisodus acutangulus]|uniref:Uncharacterized protein n=1 Tax=Anisodus acutangulus TaxID=402998 RepID=A0A9Q1M156_9SOLA|nr:hypothetical protein K7X08_029856 [Anisodus acutangulus]
MASPATGQPPIEDVQSATIPPTYLNHPIPNQTNATIINPATTTLQIPTLPMKKVTKEEQTEKSRQYQRGRNEEQTWKPKENEPHQSNQYVSLQNMDDEVIDLTTKNYTTKEIADNVMTGCSTENNSKNANSEGKEASSNGKNKKQQSEGAKNVKESTKEWIKASFTLDVIDDNNGKEEVTRSPDTNNADKQLSVVEPVEQMHQSNQEVLDSLIVQET